MFQNFKQISEFPPNCKNTQCIREKTAFITSHPAACSTRCCSFLEQFQIGTVYPRRYWSPSPCTVSYPGFPSTCNTFQPLPPVFCLL